ncbi:MAG TPA: YciI family protein [Candidatus Limnocylindria bacterium]|nr:YciI family protein [Candidatus Limnocylindria bacterium]
MKYLLLLYDDAAAVAAMTAAERRAMVDDHVAYAAMLRERGVHRAGEPLDAPETARTLRFGEGAEPVVTDGPFLESKEALGGFYLLECSSEEEALALTKQVPRSPGLVAELRPIPEV